MSVTEFAEEMKALGLSDEEIVYLIEVDSLRRAAGMYADLGTLASLLGRLVRPLPYDVEPLYNIEGVANGSLSAYSLLPKQDRSIGIDLSKAIVIDDPEANIITREDFGL